ncbi:SGNH/GDSL hydrolase family protein [Streptomyces sp. NPDC005925]|uniref:SGNH/GDSL hydrolase family protein n=1 Tax=Streptomyces sp. NPDC005925 TaxID=3157172 RepID=UPI0033FB4C5E
MRRSRIAVMLSSLALAAVSVLTGASTASAATGPYVALGDSYASGVGAGSYTSESGSCKRSTNAAPYLWAASHAPSSFSFMACSGAVTSDVLNNQLGPVNASTSLVSIAIGGNDAGFADVMTTCVTSSDSGCLSRINTARSFVQSTLPGRLDNVYNAIRGRAPSARVVVLGYPRFYKLGASCLGLSETKRAAINDAADYMNDTIGNVARNHGFTFGDVRGTFTGHELCSGSAWLHSVNWTNIGESYHPTASGQSGGYLPVLTNAA